MPWSAGGQDLDGYHSELVVKIPRGWEPKTPVPTTCWPQSPGPSSCLPGSQLRWKVWGRRLPRGQGLSGWTPVRKAGVQEWAEREVGTQLRPPASPPESSRAALQSWPQIEARKIEASPTQGGSPKTAGGAVPQSVLLPFPAPGSEGQRKVLWEDSLARCGEVFPEGREFCVWRSQAPHPDPKVTSSTVPFEQIVQRMRSGRRVWAAGEPWALEWVPEE